MLSVIVYRSVGFHSSWSNPIYQHQVIGSTSTTWRIVFIGFFLSASVLAEAPIQSTPSNFTPIHRVSLMFDRTCITSCSCTCTVEVEGISQQQSLNQRSDLQNDSYLHTAPTSLPKQQVADSGVWCAHVVATCLKRIRSPGSVIYRPPISESLSKLNKNELQLFAQQLICHVGARKVVLCCVPYYPIWSTFLFVLILSFTVFVSDSSGRPKHIGWHSFAPHFTGEGFRGGTRLRFYYSIAFSVIIK